MNTEITDKKKSVVFYDAECAVCTASARRMEGLLHTRDIELAPLQAPWVGDCLGRTPEQLRAEMHLLLPDGRIFAGADAFVQLSRCYWWGWPFHLLAKLPGARPVLRLIYRWVARNRTCLNGACQIRNDKNIKPPVAEPCITGNANKRPRVLPLPGGEGRGEGKRNDPTPAWKNSGWTGFLLILAMAFPIFISHPPAWVLMWLLAFALYAGCKWLTYREARAAGQTTTLPRALGYLLAWPGMDATAFIDTNHRATKPLPKEWLFALAKTFLGAMLIWFIARRFLTVNPLLAGWTGMVGVIFLLHFGAFHLLSLIWRNFGVHAMPIMRNPMLATSVAEFWGRRWNVAFHELARRYTFGAFRRAMGVTAATLLVFTVSGLIHDLLISLPARGGYGLPTTYFVVQGLGVIGEHTRLGRRIGLGHGLRGWAFTVLVTAGPAFWLFHPPFIRNVILPMLQAIGAT